ncbi:aromatic amino acid transport family protein [Lentisphaerota bacterium ZTH]|nr:hypothetical protein JYG24_04390 [Lentisphaerota bacterium]WET07254.1 aromatic amino acid transport family protein [Lentisphaerota bacterium ZTH]
MKGQTSILSKATMCLLIIGSLVGAGILALPVQIGIAGLLPALIGLVTLGSCMLYSGIILAREVADSKDDLFHYPTLFSHYLGPAGKWIAIGANALIFHGLLVAYLAGGAAVITRFFGDSSNMTLALVLFFAVLVSIVLCGKRMVHHSNSLLILMMWVLFGVIIVISQRHADYLRYEAVDWKFFPFSLPVILTAYWFHGIIPNVCRHLNWNLKETIKVMTVAIAVGTLMYIIWTFAAIGAIPLAGSKNSLINTFHASLPATVPLQRILGSRIFALMASLFALAALMTSYISLALGNIGFHEDLFRHVIRNRRREFILAVSFLPSFLIALFFPNAFLKAVNLVGGVGIAILYGVLPGIIGIIRYRRNKCFWRIAVSSLVLVIFSLLLCWQVLVEFGILKPHI